MEDHQPGDPDSQDASESQRADSWGCPELIRISCAKSTSEAASQGASADFELNRQLKAA